VKRSQLTPYSVEPWRPDHDATGFSSGMASIDKYIKEQAHRDMSSRTSLVFVLLEPRGNVIRAYYTLSSIGVLFNDLPKSAQKKLPRYPQTSATLLGRLGVDKNHSEKLRKQLGEKKRLGEFMHR
jgi:hypothetical protein